MSEAAMQLAAIATAARQESVLDRKERELRDRLKANYRDQETERRQAVEGLLDERTVEVAAKWLRQDRERQVEIGRLKAEIATLQAQRLLVREALVLAARRWVFTGQQRNG